VSIARQSAADAVCQAFAIVLSMGAGIFISRILGADGRGLYVLATSVASGLLLAVSNFGIPLACRVAVAADPADLSPVHTFSVLIALTAGGITGGLCLIFLPVLRGIIFPGLDLLSIVLVTVTLPVLLYQMFWRGLMIGLGRVITRAVMDLLLTAINVFGIVLLILLFHEDATLPLIVSWYLLTTLGVVLMVILIRREGARWIFPGWARCRRLLDFGRWVYIGEIGTRLRTLLDQLIVNAAGGEFVLGLYNQAASLASRSSLFGDALDASIYQTVCSAPSREAGRLVASAIRQMLILGAGMSAAAWFIAPLIPIIYGSDFAASVPAFRLLVPAFCLLGAARMVPVYFSGHLQRPKVAMAVNWLSIAFQVPVTLVLIQAFGPLNGAMWGTAASFAFVTAAFLILFTARPETPPAFDLIRFRKEDFQSWMRLFHRRQV